MRCEQIQELLSPYLDKMTNQQENKMIEDHLDNCFTCSYELEQMQRTCALLHNIETHEAPEGFVKDVHRRVAKEKREIFHSAEVSTPRKPGWIAASVAGVALAAGIYLSSFLPVGAMVAALQDWGNRDQDKPNVAIEEIINRNKQQLAQENQEQQTQTNTQVAIVDNGEGQANSVGNDNPIGNVASNIEPETTPTVDQPAVVVDPKMAESYTTKIRVEDIGDSVQKVYQIASADGTEMVLRPSNSTVMDATTQSKVKVVSLLVDEADVDKVLASLGALGASNPVQSRVNYTSQYTENVEAIASLQQSILVLEAKDEITVAEEAQLTEWQKQRTDLEVANQQMDEASNQIKIEVHLVEQTQP
ncbi:MAG: zf-HC2 domain-containing protein [Bacillota bacterium]|nr:zf-HC2 domain-containing protein [Bacillota bacterium]